MAPKRHRTASKVEESDQSSSSSSSSYSKLFPVCATADLVVESSDGTHFAVRSLHLRAASSVLDDLLGIPTCENQDTKDRLPLIKLAEKADEIEIFLRYGQPDRLCFDGKPPRITWHAVCQLSKLLDKYDSPLVAHTLMTDQLPRYIGNPLLPSTRSCRRGVTATEVFVVACLHGKETLAKDALRWHHVWGFETKNGIPTTLKLRGSVDPDLASLDWRPSGLGDVPVELLSRLPTSVVRFYSALHLEVLVTPGYSWLDAAGDFKVRFHPPWRT